MSFKSLTESFQRIEINTTAIKKKYSTHNYKSNRNPRCIPSDDDDDEAIEKHRAVINKKAVKNTKEKRCIETTGKRSIFHRWANECRSPFFCASS
ncbi:hypothetical protein BY458DRAFT_508528 [Sporodiniella umbellata]|nr:hypothetical protein BY458DRAFT_508528 [Sporodiniella umbellata]